MQHGSTLRVLLMLRFASQLRLHPSSTTDVTLRFTIKVANPAKPNDERGRAPRGERAYERSDF